MTLRELQIAFVAALRDPAETAALLPHIDGCKADPAARIRIHRRTMYGALVGALSSAFPVCRRVLGAPFFDAMARRYLARTPSRTSDLHRYGADLPIFLAGFAPAAELAYLPDLARLEWARHIASCSRPIAAADLAALAAIPPLEYPDLCFEACVSLSLLQSPYPVVTIWRVNQPDWLGELDVDLADPGDTLVVWRSVDGVDLETLPGDAYKLLDALVAQHRLGDLTQDLAQALPRYLRSFVAKGWLRLKLPLA